MLAALTEFSGPVPGGSARDTDPRRMPPWASRRPRRGSRLLLWTEAVGKRFGGVDISNGDEERAQAIALRRHAEG
jgi:hypothetical protein